MSLAERIRTEISLRDLAERRGVEWDRRKSVPAKGDWWAPCPFHGERTPSFHVVEPGRAGGWFHCFGCGLGGSAIDFLMQLDGLQPGAAMKRLAEDAGIERERDPAVAAKRAAELAERRAEAERRAARTAEKRLRAARAIWRAAHAAPGLLADYLTARGVDIHALPGIPPTLRAHPGLNCRADGQSRREPPAHAGPAMVAAIGRARDFRGVHRTWITPHGRARWSRGGNVPKKWLGRTGAIFGQPVMLSPRAPVVVVGEGIETTLAAFAALLRAGARPGEDGIAAEAALSRGALAGAWAPPAGTCRVVLLAEGSSRPARAPDADNPKGCPSGAEEAERITRAAQGRLAGLGLFVAVVLPGGAWDRDCDAADIARAAAADA